MAEHIATHVLSLTPDYCVHWTVWEAVRELLQNAIDQHTSNRASLPEITYDGTNTLVVRCSNCSLAPRTLLLGQSGKQAIREAIGQHGEGYKLALLVLTRLSYEVELYTGGEIWRPSFVFSDEYGSSVMQVERARCEQNDNSVTYRIRDFDPQDWDTVTDRFLGFDHPQNVILDEDYLRGRVFVGGLWVCDMQGLEYGYNFSPDRIRLDRDRGLASTFDITWESSRLWEDHGDNEKLYNNISRRGLDTQYVRLSNPDVSRYVVDRYMNEHGPDTIPVATDVEANRLQQTGHKVARVPDAVRDLLRRMHKFSFNRQGTPGERVERFQHAFGHELKSTDAKNELESIVQASAYWVGPAEAPVDEMAEESRREAERANLKEIER